MFLGVTITARSLLEGHSTSLALPSQLPFPLSSHIASQRIRECRSLLSSFFSFFLLFLLFEKNGSTLHSFDTGNRVVYVTGNRASPDPAFIAIHPLPAPSLRRSWFFGRRKRRRGRRGGRAPPRLSRADALFDLFIAVLRWDGRLSSRASTNRFPIIFHARGWTHDAELIKGESFLSYLFVFRFDLDKFLF